MQKKEYIFKLLDEYVLRTPLLPFQNLSYLTLDKIKDFCLNPIVSEAIFISSPSLHNEMIKYFDKGLINKDDKIILTLTKFIYRMSSRATPFGLFSGCSVGKFDTKSDIVLKSPQAYGRLTQLDMNFLCTLVQHKEKNPKNRLNILFHPNNSLYHVGKELRYIEFKYKNSRKQHFTVSISNTEFIDLVLQRSKKGASIDDLVNFLCEFDQEVSKIDATNFINHIIDNQILVSTISNCLTGEIYLSKIIEDISSEKDKEKLRSINELLKKIDNSPIGTTLDYYKQIIEALDTFEIDYDSKFLFQTDLVVANESNQITEELLGNLKKALRILNKLTLSTEDINIENFKRKFYDRYEDEEIPLSIALDVETGIGYGSGLNDEDSYDLSPLTEGLDLSGNRPGNDYQEIKWSSTDEFLNKKLLESINSNEIELTDEDLSDFEENWEDIPLSFSVILNVLNDKANDSLCHIDFAGGATASFLLGRFGHSSKDIEKIVKQIVQKEEEQSNKIFAEIVHLPEDRVGNIIYRPTFRNFEIPYLANSGVPLDNQISLEDILISIKRDKIVLRSRKHDKIIEPRMASAHNYSFNALPVYHFLCDIQSQDLRDNLTFSWGNAARNFKSLPRIKYKNIILSLGKWYVFYDEIKLLTDTISVQKWRKNRNLPSKVFINEASTTLLIDFTSQLSIAVFIATIKNMKEITLIEFLFDEKQPLTHCNNKAFTNEVILSFYKSLN